MALSPGPVEDSSWATAVFRFDAVVHQNANCWSYCMDTDQVLRILKFMGTEFEIAKIRARFAPDTLRNLAKLLESLQPPSRTSVSANHCYLPELHPPTGLRIEVWVSPINLSETDPWAR